MTMALDSSMDPMEEIRYRKKYSNHWQAVLQDTHFNFDELEKIMVIFLKISKRDEKRTGPPGTISRAHFKDVLHTGLNMTDVYLMERVQVALDRGTSPYVTMATFAKAFSLFMRGTMAEKIEYCFTCYDLMAEGFLRRESMYQCLRKSLTKSSPDDDIEEAAKELVDILLKRIDVDMDGTVSFDDYRTSVERAPRLLQLLGPCLPERQAVFAFIATWCPSWVKM